MCGGRVDWGVLAGDMWGWRCCGAGASAHYLADGLGCAIGVWRVCAVGFGCLWCAICMCCRGWASAAAFPGYGAGCR